MRNEDQPSSLDPQVERAANEGMVDVAPPRAEPLEEGGDLDDTRIAARRLLELQLVAVGAYESTLEALEANADAAAIADVAEQLRQDIDAIRAQLVRLHDYEPVETPRGTGALDRVTGIAAGMIGEAGSANGLMVGELAMLRTAEAVLSRGEIIPSVAAALRRATVDRGNARIEALRAIT